MPAGLGVLGFGLIIGWYVYYINRYRKGDVQISDITTLIAAIGGASVLSLFGDTGSAKAELFNAYGIGLAIGFFGYFAVLVILVGISKNFDSDWFLDGRRKNPAEGYSIPGDLAPSVRPMAPAPHPDGFHGTNPGTTQNFYLGGEPIQPAPGRAVRRPGPEKTE